MSTEKIRPSEEPVSRNTSVSWEEAVRLCGSVERLLRGVKANRKGNWENTRKVPAGHVLRIYEERVKEAGQAPPDLRPSERREIWQDAEWQATHSFTAMVVALRHLEEIPARSPRAWRTRVAW